jgi:hypothetical protein
MPRESTMLIILDDPEHRESVTYKIENAPSRERLERSIGTAWHSTITSKVVEQWPDEVK